MRFISKFGRFGVQIRPQVQEAHANGTFKVLQEAVYAQFEPWKLRPEERELAIATWVFNGYYQLEDEATVMAPDYRIGIFDSIEAATANGWSDELRLEVEQSLVAAAAFNGDMLVVPNTFFAPPWPRYNEFAGDVETLVQKLVVEGHVLPDVLGYERESLNRPAVIEALEALISDPDALLELQAEEILG